MNTTAAEPTRAELMLQAALVYEAAGFSLVPIDPRTKKPREAWADRQTTRATPDEIRGWARRGGLEAFAVVCGAVSGGLEAIDFDSERFYVAWRAAVGELADRLPVTRSGSGQHVLYRRPEVPGNTKLAWQADDADESGRVIAIETRGEGGYLVLPPSRHPSGKLYEVESGDPSQPPVISDALAEALLAAARRLDEAPKTRQQREADERRAKESTQYRAQSNGSASVIDEFNRRTDIRATLESYGYVPVGDRYKRKGGKSDSVTVRDGRSFHHSSNDQMSDGYWHRPFAVFCRLSHGDDCGAAVKAAAELMGMQTSGRFSDTDPAAEESLPDNDLPLPPSWPDPLAPEAFYGLAGDIANAIDPHTEADLVAVLFQILVGFGNIAGRSAHFVADASTHYLNEYMVLIGLTAKGRKGTSWANAHFLFKSADPDWAQARIGSGLSSGEGLIWNVRDAVVKRVPVKAKGRFTGEYDEVTEHEAVDDKRLLLMEPEFSQPLKVMKREGNTLSPIVRLAWDTGNLRSLTKNCPATATGAHISIIGHITKDELRRELDETCAANGFGNRFLWVCVQRSKCLPDGGALHTVDFSELHNRLVEAIGNAKDATLITRDAEARDLWHQVYADLSEGKPGMAGGMTSRAESHVMRLACLYALLDCQRVARVPHLRAALAAWKYVEQSVAHVFGGASGDPLADSTLSALNAHPEGLSRTDIYNLFSRHIDSSKIQQCLILLAQQGKATWVKEKTKGRDVERWYLRNGATSATSARRGKA